MSDAEPEATSAESGEPGRRVSFWRVAIASMIASIFVFLLLILARAVLPEAWEFSVEIDTQVVEISLRPDSDTQWRIDGAVICARAALPLPDAARIRVNPNPCGSRAWQAWRLAAPEQVLRLNGGTTVSLQTLPGRGYAMSLRAADGATLGAFSVVGVIDEVAIGDALNLIWEKDAIEPRTYPFSGTTVLGRAVAWSDTRLLESGKVAVFTGDESADKRTLLDEAELMLGDQVSLGMPAEGQAWPKGFVRVAEPVDQLQVVAFGRADSLRIERFGNSGYDFRPGLLAKLSADPVIAFWGSLLAAYMTLILSLQPFMSDRRKSTIITGTRRQRLYNWFVQDGAD